MLGRSTKNNTMLLCLAYPQLSQADTKLIRDFRLKHDQKYVDVVDAHWTMIFPGSCEGISQDDLQSHISGIALQSDPINITCRYALVYDDNESDDYYIFLVPDEGFSAISLLHDKLYDDFMRPALRLDIPYVPHIGIATSKDKDHLYNLAKEWNSKQFEIKSTIDELTLCSYNGKRVTNLQSFSLTNQ
jgi:2'-5' RNA ligase